jgi:hypothetical protein
LEEILCILWKGKQGGVLVVLYTPSVGTTGNNISSGEAPSVTYERTESTESKVSNLKEFNKLKEDGIISEEEFNELKKRELGL